MRFEMGQLQSSIRDAAAQGTIGAAVNTADFSKWHVVMGFHRGWEHRAWIDGVELPPRAFSTWMPPNRSEEHTSELQSLLRISYALFCLNKKTNQPPQNY